MFSITLKLMKKSARMLIPAGIAILIGTAFIAATFLFSNTMNDSLGRQQTAQMAGANYVVMPDTQALKALSDSGVKDGGAGSRTVADFHLDQVRAIDGVSDVRADTNATLIVTNKDKNVTGIAVGTSRTAALLPVSVVEGDRPADNDEIALPKTLAGQLGVSIGDTVTVTSPIEWTSDGNGAAADVRVVGLTDDPHGLYSSYGGASVISDNVMAAMNGVDDFSQVSTYQLLLDLGGDGNGKTADAKAQAAAGQIAKLMPKYYKVMTRDDANSEAIKALSTSAGTDITTTFLLSFGVLAMLVAALVIANTFQVLVAQRRRTLALLRTIGAKKGQLYGSVLFEAGILGLIASLLGVALGIALMGGLTASGVMASAGMDARLVLSWPVFAVPIAFGIVMTVLASLGSARSATAVTPLEALRPIELTDTRRAGVLRAVGSILLIVAGLALAVFAAWQNHEMNTGRVSMASDNYATVLLMAIAGCAFIFLGMVLSATFWLPALMRGIGALVSLAGPSARIAHANIQKNPRRVAATGAALLIGVTLVSTIATGAASAKQTMGEALDRRYSVDMIAAGPDMTDAQVKDAAKVKGVADTVYAPATVMYTTPKDGGDVMAVMLIGVDDADALRKVMKADLSGVTIDDGTALLPKYSAISGKEIAFDANGVTFRPNSYGVQARDGSAVADGSAADDVSGDAGSAGSTADRTITLKPVQRDYRRVSSDLDAAAFVSAAHFANGDLTATEHMLLMRVDATGSDLGVTLAGVQDAFSSSAGVGVSGPIAQRLQWETMINGMMALLVGLIAVAVLIALVGVANTLSLSVIERTRESATLRAIGMTRGQLRRSLAVEALMLSLVAGVVGVALGTLFGWLGSYMVFSQYGSIVFPFEWSVNGAVLGVAAVAALLASVFPARRAVRTPPVEALAEA
ncbi:MAG: FtsX-like permease family protein [Bifidobacterium scardovii]|uniref:ABC transporter permease n=1 Tax=Bifidobacterium scardovii TaxID=158787 RepID=UPI0028FF5B70|nr:FtsX-like permease family protein [Bifidobacterium scardovii]MDU2420725.1 FtsX-like permease family protein [Bifidobacterium scardovii]